MKNRKANNMPKKKIKLFMACPNCSGRGFTETLEYIDRTKYKGLPQTVRHHCEKCDHGYVPYKKQKGE